MPKRISITGPESTGKSELAANLARHYKTVYVPEYSREYLKDIGTDYSLEDVLKIAQGQLASEMKYLDMTNQYLFCDTDMLVAKIWCREVYKKVPEWIERMLVEHPYDLYLLCYPDLEWQPDVLRENPENREYLFEQFVKELEHYNFNYRVVKGQDSERLKNAITFVDNYFAE
ncbi:MAG: ATP-binding protein [Bacteroidales bacterium]|jgi:NadR type nicotinamide-nucleotide adenylyltransferase|nr:ATP-binding protein [Bacteroidales bacterium]